MVENNEECYDENDTEETLHKTGKKLDYCLEEMFQYIVRSAETVENSKSFILNWFCFVFHRLFGLRAKQRFVFCNGYAAMLL